MMNGSFWDFLINDDSDEEEQKHRTNVAIAAVVTYVSMLEAPRPSFVVRDRLVWEEHVAILASEGPLAFLRMYRMTYESFMKLCNIIQPYVVRNLEMARRRSLHKEPITVEIMLHCLLRWLSGGSYLDVRVCAGISTTSFYKGVYACVNAILQCDGLSYSFPSDNASIAAAAMEWKEYSTSGIVSGCVACMDGLLLQIQTPPSKDTGNVKAYFSGHYQTYGINVQAACDAKCRFIFAQLAAPGGANDIAAFRKTRLREVIDQFPLGYYVIGDNAYVCSEHILTPFPGTQKMDPKKDAYNFYLSQLRIRIEMTFGLLVNKWRIFKKPLQTSLKQSGKLFLCATRLHNFCINEDNDVSTDINNMSRVTGEEEFSFEPSDIEGTTIQGTSMMRDILVDKIAEEGLTRPTYNLQRNNGKVQE